MQAYLQCNQKFVLHSPSYGSYSYSKPTGLITPCVYVCKQIVEIHSDYCLLWDCVGGHFIVEEHQLPQKQERNAEKFPRMYNLVVKLWASEEVLS